MPPRPKSPPPGAAHTRPWGAPDPVQTLVKPPSEDRSLGPRALPHQLRAAEKARRSRVKKEPNRWFRANQESTQAPPPALPSPPGSRSHTPADSQSRFSSHSIARSLSPSTLVLSKSLDRRSGPGTPKGISQASGFKDPLCQPQRASPALKRQMKELSASIKRGETWSLAPEFEADTSDGESQMKILDEFKPDKEMASLVSHVPHTYKLGKFTADASIVWNYHREQPLVLEEALATELSRALNLGIVDQ